ncbi:MAG: 2,3-bisphosphoglycerate-independent phosphoglycerate mutase [Deltaproteobacteria bacterium]|nr:2,3-bisphosphoglycerate-independent phosphoglycerate mutase [Deltaproteobacteria bacterium]
MNWSLRRTETKAAGPVLIVVMDGVGVGPDNAGNAVRLARTPTLDRLQAEAPYLTLKAHGTAVGLPSDDDMGNSEVGHNALGAGRVFDQGAKLVNAALAEGRLFAGDAWQALTGRARSSGGALHFIGLLSDGNVHSHIDHLVQMIDRAAEEGVKRLFVHPLLDGRDVPETSALTYVEALEACLARHHGREGRTFRIASGGGRMKVTMDRYEADWDMVALGWKTHVLGEGRRFPSCKLAVETLRDEQPGIIDQDLPAFVIGDADGPAGPIRDGDSVIFFNFRGDRAIEISRAFEQEDFTAFERGPRPDVLYAGMMEYDGDYHIPSRYLVRPPAIDHTMGEYLVKNGARIFACSETQKFGHVTYFWNGNRGGMFDETREEYLEVPSDRLPFEQRPWMQAAQITDATITALASGRFDLLRINYANGDMVGHTGHREAAVLAVQTVDLCLARVLAAVKKAGGVALVTADHGNADEMYMWDKKAKDFKRNPAGGYEAKTSHTLNPVPFHLYDPAARFGLRADLAGPGLANVAATALELLGFEAPEGYAPSLLAPR